MPEMKNVTAFLLGVLLLCLPSCTRSSSSGAGAEGTLALTRTESLSWSRTVLPPSPSDTAGNLGLAGVYAGMIDGRLVLAGLSGKSFTWELFIAGAFTNAVPGIILHIVLIPVLVMVTERAGLTLNRKKGAQA